jgi:hypothetical protein
MHLNFLMVLKIKICQNIQRRLKIELENKEYEYGFYTGWKPFLWFKRGYRSCYFAQGEPQWMIDCGGFSFGSK